MPSDRQLLATLALYAERMRELMAKGERWHAEVAGCWRDFGQAMDRLRRGEERERERAPEDPPEQRIDFRRVGSRTVRVYAAIQQHPDASAAELAAATGISADGCRWVARRLVAAGKVERRRINGVMRWRANTPPPGP